MRSQFDLVRYYISPPSKTFWTSNYQDKSAFLTSNNFFILRKVDGKWRWMVVMDGPRVSNLDVGKNILFGNVSKTTRNFVLIVSPSPPTEFDDIL